jgi:hypothetical protein
VRIGGARAARGCTPLGLTDTVMHLRLDVPLT